MAVATAMAAAGKPARWRGLAFANIGALLAHFGFLGPILAAYAPRRLLLTYFNLFLRRRARRLLNVVDPYITIDISECPTSSRYDPVDAKDTTYDEVKAYLSATSSSEARELHAEGATEGDGLVLSMRDGQDVADEFKGVTMWWSSVTVEELMASSHGHGTGTTRPRGVPPYVKCKGSELLFGRRRRRLYTNNKMSEYAYDEKAWSYVDFDHPTTFETLGMEPEKKKAIMDDLDTFQKSKDFYSRIGKVWKRGYLLYGPPGTGKSTMIAAMANYLDYDIYDLELTMVSNNNDLRKLLIETTSKSIIIIEDIDCSLHLTGDRATRSPSWYGRRQSSQVTLSGLLNFIDGLWSSCGSERIIVFTTNHVGKLDPAREDGHAHRDVLLRTLAKNYLCVDSHELFADVEALLKEVEISPADVAECLMTAKRSGSDDTSCLEICIDELKKRVEEKAKALHHARRGSSWRRCSPRTRRLLLTYFNLVLRRRARRVLAAVDPYVTIDIPDPGAANDQYRSRLERRADDTTYEEVKAYLSAACSSSEARELVAEGTAEGRGLVVSMREGQDVEEEYKGVTFWWSSVNDDEPRQLTSFGVNNNNNNNNKLGSTQRLTFHQRHRYLVVDEYLPHVRRSGREILFHNRHRRLYTNNKNPFRVYRKPWSYINFDHPTTFDTLAMEPEKKKEIMDDLDVFRRNKEFYRRAGKPWKRGYLLYGPPGTGKSTMIAAMANYLDYDIYDVELTIVDDNNDLRKLLIETTSKSIIVIEDIDCSLNITGDRAATQRPSYGRRGDNSTLTLSGLLNFIDGLCSATGGERIVLFTTNHVSKLDPALIRRGRMDMHIEMSYCRAAAFRTLAKNYLGIDAHHMFDEIDEILNNNNITPADVAESLMAAKRSSSGDDMTSCLKILIDELKKRIEEDAKAAAEAKVRAEEAEKARVEYEAKKEARAMAAAMAGHTVVDDYEEDDSDYSDDYDDSDDDYSDYTDDD
uniref:AAA+ ATPase domain-containing protein n=1 Tax=Leersia perrieri TaxID=77586 RepID=A0A0D9WWG5_9ORYZ